MSDRFEDKAPDLPTFLSAEEHQLLVSIANRRDEMQLVGHVDGFFAAALRVPAIKENDYVVVQLLTFAHYHFLFCLACDFRCHLSEAFASARAAIDAALIAAHIIKDRSAQVAYAKREAPFDNFTRYLGNLLAAGKTLPHPVMRQLIKQYKTISTFAAHADIGTFVHRINKTTENGRVTFGVNYFQFGDTDDKRKLYTLTLLHTFVMILDVFADFLVEEQAIVPLEWKQRLHALGGALERRAAALREKLRGESDAEG